MLSRIFWVGIAGLALVTGMVLQGDFGLLGFGDRAIDTRIDRTVDRTVDRAVDRSVDHLRVVGADGRQVTISPDTKRALVEAVGRLAKAEADHAVLRIGDAGEEEMRTATARRAEARAEVDRLKAEIERQEEAAATDRDAIRDEVRREIRDSVREAVRN